MTLGWNVSSTGSFRSGPGFAITTTTRSVRTDAGRGLGAGSSFFHRGAAASGRRSVSPAAARRKPVSKRVRTKQKEGQSE
jgi:hypothetical protein